MGNERGSGSSSSSRKSKKNNSDKPKQPQRGLGVAQLEKIRLHGQMGCATYHPSLHGPYPTNFNNVIIIYLSLSSHCFDYYGCLLKFIWICKNFLLMELWFCWPCSKRIWECNLQLILQYHHHHLFLIHPHHHHHPQLLMVSTPTSWYVQLLLLDTPTK